MSIQAPPTAPPAGAGSIESEPPRPRRSAATRSKYRFVVICLLPAIILYIVFMIIPAINVFRMSVFRWSGLSGNQTFVGLDNFRILSGDMQFVRAFQNTILLFTLVTIVTMALALLMAALLTHVPIKGRDLYRLLIYIPNVLSVVVIAAMFSAIYDQRYGLINYSLEMANLEFLQQVWMGDRRVVIYSIGIAMVWQSAGYYMVMYMAGMSNIPASLYEASSLDGATGIRQFFTITLPLVWTQIRTTLTFFVLSSVNLSFVLVVALTGGGPDGASQVLLSYMYEQAYTNSTYGYGMAIGVVVFSFSFLLSFAIDRATKREPLTF